MTDPTPERETIAHLRVWDDNGTYYFGIECYWAPNWDGMWRRVSRDVYEELRKHYKER